MFDTSVVRAGAVAAPRRITLLTASVAIHTAAILAAVTMSLASTDLPTEAPRQLEMFRTFELPPGPPPPKGNPEAKREATPQQKPQVLTPKPDEVTPPTEIPVETPQLEAPTVSTEGPSTDQGTGEGTFGTPDGVDGSVGVPGGGGGTGAPADITYHPGEGVTSARVLSRVEPRFPRALIHGVRAATVVVTCVIDKDGNIRDPKIVVSSFPPFNQSVLDALHQWKFAPGSYRGVPVDTYFELKVRFEVK